MSFFDNILLYKNSQQIQEDIFEHFYRNVTSDMDNSESYSSTFLKKGMFFSVGKTTRLQYFNEQKQKAQKLKAEIDNTDKKIDQMVYALYGLTDEEIKFIEKT